MKSHDVAKLLLELPNLEMVCTAAYSGAMNELKLQRSLNETHSS